MGIGCFLTIIATFVQTWSPKGNLGCFIGGRVLIGLGQGIALSKYSSSTTKIQANQTFYASCWSSLHRGTCASRNTWEDYGFLAALLLGRIIHRLLDQLCLLAPRSRARRVGLENGCHIPVRPFLPLISQYLRSRTLETCPRSSFDPQNISGKPILISL